jgi:hypothetical protein
MKKKVSLILLITIATLIFVTIVLGGNVRSIRGKTENDVNVVIQKILSPQNGYLDLCLGKREILLIPQRLEFDGQIPILSVDRLSGKRKIYWFKQEEGKGFRVKFFFCNESLLGEVTSNRITGFDEIYILDLARGEKRKLLSTSYSDYILGNFVPVFLDENFLLFEAWNKKLVNEKDKLLKEVLAKAEGKELCEKKEERLNSLMKLYATKGSLTPAEKEEFMHLVLKKYGKESIRKWGEIYQLENEIFRGKEYRIVDLSDAKVRCIFKKGEFAGYLPNEGWVYFFMPENRSLWRVKPDNPEAKEKLGCLSNGWNKIGSPVSIRVGDNYIFAYRDLNKGICDIYDRQNLRYIKTVNYGDPCFPRYLETSSWLKFPAPIILLSNLKFSLSWGEGGIFIKDLDKGKVKRIESRKPHRLEISSDENVIVYLVKGTKSWELWLYSFTKGRRERILP